MKKIYAIILFALFVINANAQTPNRYSATFDDGTKIEFDVLEDHTDQMHKLNFVFAGYGNEISASQKTIFGTVFIPDVCFLKGGFTITSLIGLGSVGAEGLFFLGSKEKEKQTSTTLKSTYVGNNTTERKVTKFPVIRKTYFGLHGGLYQKKFSTLEFYSKGTGTFEISEVKGTEFILGAGLWRGRRLRWKVITNDGVTRQGTTQFALYADAELYIGRNFTSNETTIDGMGNNIVSGEVVNKDDVIAPFVYRIYFEGKMAFVGTKDFGIYYQLGAGKGAYLLNTSFCYIAGFGVYMGF